MHHDDETTCKSLNRTHANIAEDMHRPATCACRQPISVASIRMHCHALSRVHLACHGVNLNQMIAFLSIG